MVDGIKPSTRKASDRLIKPKLTNKQENYINQIPKEIMDKILMDNDMSAIVNFCNTNKITKEKCDTDVNFWKQKFYTDRVPYMVKKAPTTLKGWLKEYKKAKKAYNKNLDLVDAETSMYYFTNIPGKDIAKILPKDKYDQLSETKKQKLNNLKLLEMELNAMEDMESVFIKKQLSDKKRVKVLKNGDYFKKAVKIKGKEALEEILFNIMNTYPTNEIQSIYYDDMYDMDDDFNGFGGFGHFGNF